MIHSLHPFRGNVVAAVLLVFGSATAAESAEPSKLLPADAAVSFVLRDIDRLQKNYDALAKASGGLWEPILPGKDSWPLGEALDRSGAVVIACRPPKGTSGWRQALADPWRWVAALPVHDTKQALEQLKAEPTGRDDVHRVTVPAGEVPLRRLLGGPVPGARKQPPKDGQQDGQPDAGEPAAEQPDAGEPADRVRLYAAAQGDSLLLARSVEALTWFRKPAGGTAATAGNDAVRSMLDETDVFVHIDLAALRPALREKPQPGAQEDVSAEDLERMVLFAEMAETVAELAEMSQLLGRPGREVFNQASALSGGFHLEPDRFKVSAQLLFAEGTDLRRAAEQAKPVKLKELLAGLPDRPLLAAVAVDTKSLGPLWPARLEQFQKTLRGDLLPKPYREWAGEVLDRLGPAGRIAAQVSQDSPGDLTVLARVGFEDAQAVFRTFRETRRRHGENFFLPPEPTVQMVGRMLLIRERRVGGVPVDSFSLDFPGEDDISLISLPYHMQVGAAGGDFMFAMSGREDPLALLLDADAANPTEASEVPGVRSPVLSVLPDSANAVVLMDPAGLMRLVDDEMPAAAVKAPAAPPMALTVALTDDGGLRLDAIVFAASLAALERADQADDAEEDSELPLPGRGRNEPAKPRLPLPQ